MKQVLFGGSFDPPHLGHTRVIRALEKSYEKVIIIPSGPHLFKQQESSFDDRRGLIEAWLSGFDEFAIDVDWSQLASNSRCFDLLEKYFSEGEVMSFCIGEDLLEQLPDWYRSEELKSRVCFVVIPRRPDFETQNQLKFHLQKMRELPDESPKAFSGNNVDSLDNRSKGLIKQLTTEGFQLDFLDDFEPLDVSSSRIRELILNSDERCRDLLDSVVWEYIQSRNMYSA